ncbi:MAG: ABC transporter permease [Acidobacteria bacterium]|nr:ABC transporter permease [Acidobacteriota bacterium]
MSALARQFALHLRLYFRNTMAMVYGYLFPTIFLIAFWTLYRYDQVPLVRHMGELLTITVLGGACFGLPTTIVGERERGVWRRYRLTPVPTAAVVASTVLARYVLLLTAGALQLVLAMGLGMPWPRHPLDLWLAFTFVSFAFLGLGLVIATMADNVPAVQALGQSLFLPMLIIGGVAVPLTSLPPWAEHVSAFLPGRYAVEVIQAAVSGSGLTGSLFNLAALLAIGVAGCLAGGKLFRWDRDQRFAALQGKGWLAVALVAWIGVGLAAEARGRARSVASAVATVPSAPPASPSVPASNEPAAEPETPTASTTTTAAPAETPKATAPQTTTARREPSATHAPTAPPRPAVASPPAATATRSGAARAGVPPATPAEPLPATPAAAPPTPPVPASWQAVTLADIDRDLTFDRLPSDRSVVTPIATSDMQPDPDVADQVALVDDALLSWSPGLVPDPVQRARNLLGVLGVHDVAQTALEAYLPRIVFRQLLDASPRDELIKVLYWIALHPEGGTTLTAEDVAPLQLKAMPPDDEEIRNRTAIYAVKLLGRLTGHIK